MRAVLLGGAVGASLLGAAHPVVGQTADARVRHTFTVGDSAFLLDGRPFQILSGEMHFSRIPRELWRHRLRMARAMGLNTVATYVFWNVHEPRPGVFEFSGNADVAAFARTAQEEGLFVILRPGPYACAEWEFGGYPWWLLQTPPMAVRIQDPRFLAASERYINALGGQTASLQVNRGGPILMVQVENEYGSFGADHAYMRRIRDMLRGAGFDGPLFTSDGPSQMPNGSLPGVLPAINGPTDSTIFTTIDGFRPGGPYFVAEFYPGWLDHWGEAHQRVDAARTAREYEWMVSRGVSVNLYMFHGGTTFGFMNGANWSNHLQPQPTSYDYDAPLDEAGRPTPKYFLLRDVLQRLRPNGVTPPPAPDSVPTIAIPRFELTASASLLDRLPRPVRAERPLAIEDLGQATGFTLYRTRLTGGGRDTLTITDLRDYGLVLVNGARVATLDRRHHQRSVLLDVPEGGGVLDILVENLGRINYGRRLPDNRHGITERVTLGTRDLTGWEMTPLPLADPARARFRPGLVAAPALYRGTFTVDRPADTFLDLRGWGKGAVWVNGHALGRYWYIGPQQTLYLPGPWLRAGPNDIIVLDLEDRAVRSVAGLAVPVLDQLEPDRLAPPAPAAPRGN